MGKDFEVNIDEAALERYLEDLMRPIEENLNRAVDENVGRSRGVVLDKLRDEANSFEGLELSDEWLDNFISAKLGEDYK